MNKWTQLNSHYVLDTKWLKVRQDEVRLPCGAECDDYFIIERNNVALIVAIDEDQNIILKEEYRYPIDKTLIEIPGGTFEPGENDGLDVAKRELLEETGYESSEWELLFTNYDYPTKDVNTVSIYLAKNAKQVSSQQLDEGEDIRFFKVPLKEALQMCMENKIQVNGSMAAILMTARKYGL